MPALPDQEAAFHVHLHEIREEILPEINDDFAKKLGSFNTIEEVKTAIQATCSKATTSVPSRKSMNRYFQH